MKHLRILTLTLPLNRYVVLFITWVLVSTLITCSSTQVQQQVSHGVPQPVATKDEVKDYSPFGKELLLKEIRGQHVNGLYQGQVMIQNPRKRRRQLQYQFTWYDAKGMEVAVDRNAWTPLVLYGFEEKTITSVSPTSDAVGFKLAVRDLRANTTFKTNFFGIK